MATATKTDLTAIVAKAREMHVAQRKWRRGRGEDPGPSWSALPDWIKLSWFSEAAAELGMEL